MPDFFIKIHEYFPGSNILDSVSFLAKFSWIFFWSSLCHPADKQTINSLGEVAMNQIGVGLVKCL